MRTFITKALEGSSFRVWGCAGVADLVDILDSSLVALVVLGPSASGIAGCEVLELLAARRFAGKVLVLGPRASPMVTAISRLGDQSGLAIVPVLTTPFGVADIRERVAALLSREPRHAVPFWTAEADESPPCKLRYRPKIDTRTVSLSGAEALPTVGSSNPDKGRPDGSLAATIARAVADWRHFAAVHGHVEIAVPVPLAELEECEALDKLSRQVPDDPAFHGMIIEIDAAEAVRNLGPVKDIARRLRHRNVAMSIDKLGLEWPILRDLHDFPFVELKVDPQLVAGCAQSPSQRATCRRILELADAMGARTVADGVESRADFLAVREMGFHQAQGGLFAKPMTAWQFARTVLGRDAAAPK
jgi:EAL domain-containing protein (putative c-di-GMP-specific phosphodiesterase class I)